MEGNHTAQEHRRWCSRPCGESDSVQVDQTSAEKRKWSYLLWIARLYTPRVAQGWCVGRQMFATQRWKVLSEGQTWDAAAFNQRVIAQNIATQEAQPEALQRHISHQRPAVPTQLSPCCAAGAAFLHHNQKSWLNTQKKQNLFFFFVRFILFDSFPSFRKMVVLIFRPADIFTVRPLYKWYLTSLRAACGVTSDP